jgi:soluble lytic murein transglycosylase-like protein
MLLPHIVSTSKPYFDETYAMEQYVKASPSSTQLYYFIEKYARIYGVPVAVAFRIAKMETNFRNPLNFRYKHNQTSIANAYGPMQVLHTTAVYVSGNDSLTTDQVLNDIELNVFLSMKYLRQLYDKYGSWALAAGYYNTGHPILNDYALQVKQIENQL